MSEEKNETKLAELRAEIARRTLESQSMRGRASALKGKERWLAQADRRAFGAITRSLLLAYACLRDRPYTRVERRCREGNAPSALRIARILDADPPSVAALDSVERWLRAGKAEA